MSKEKVELIVDGGKAGVSPAMGQQFGPLGVNIQAILDKINEKTSAFKGMKVPVKIIVDTETKDFELEIGTPPVSELVKKEINAEKGSGSQDINKIGNLSIEQTIKIAKMKKDSMLANDLKAAVKNIIGTCNTMGVLVEGEEASKTIEKVNQGAFDKEIQEEKIETPPEKLKVLKSQLQTIQAKIQEEQAKIEAEKLAAEAAKAEAEAEAAEAAGEAPAEDEEPVEGEEPKEGEEPATEEKKEEKKE